MRRKFVTGIFSFLMMFLLSALISVSAVMCFAETFKLGCDPVVLIPACCGMALVASVSMLPRRGWVVIAAEAFFLLLVVWWQWPLVTEGFRKVLFQVTTQYAKDFPVEIRGSATGDALWFLLIGGVLFSWTTAWVCSREGSALPVALVCLPVFVSCLLFVDIAPVLWLVLLTGALLLLLVTQSVRSRDPAQGNRLAWLLLAPTALLVFTVVRLSPPEEYVRKDWSDVLREMAETRLNFQEYSFTMPVTGAKWNRQLDKENLRWLGPKTLTGAHALDFRATSSISYLRGVSLGVYENNAWSAVAPRTFAAQRFAEQPQVTGSGSSESLEVRTNGRRPLLYTAYYLSAVPDNVTAIDDAYLENSQNAREYTISYSTGTLRPSEDYDAYVAETYTQLPDDLQEPLAQYIRENDLSGNSARDIAQHVKDLGVYDLDTARVPAGKDFVLYFLNESRRGYCVHFASATVLLLRSEGIPARYVSGYSVSGTPGEWSVVTEDEAHAWVEYYQVGVGWRTLDPTPAGWRTATNDSTEELETPEPPEVPEVPEIDEKSPAKESPVGELPNQEPVAENPPFGIALPVGENTDLKVESPSGGTITVVGEKILAALQRVLIYILRWLLPPLAVILLIVLRRWLVLRHRHTLCATGHPNRRLLAYWCWLARLSKVTGGKPDSSLLALAEKARFSQHTIGEDELAHLRQAVNEEIEILQVYPTVKRLWHQYGRVLY